MVCTLSYCGSGAALPRRCGDVQLQHDCATAAAVTAPSYGAAERCAVGHCVLPESEITPPRSIPPFFG